MPPLRSIEQTVTLGQALDGAAPTTIPVQQAGDLVRKGLHYPLPVLWCGHEPSPDGSCNIRGAVLLPNAQAAPLAFVEHLPRKSVSAKIVVVIMLHSVSPLRKAAMASPPRWARRRAIFVKPRPKFR
jgi:hypothetical protein